MPYRKTLILSLALSGLASCAAPSNTGCIGWRPIMIMPGTLDYMAAYDRDALAGLIGHHEFGQAQGCWQ